MRCHACLLAVLAALPLGAAEAQGATPRPVVVEEPAAVPPDQPPVAAQGEPAAAAVPERWARPWTVDLRLLLSGAAPIDEVETDAGSDEVDHAASGFVRIQALYGHRPGNGDWGFQLGGGPAFGSHIGEDGDVDLVYAVAALELTGGLLWSPTPGLQLELRPVLRVGAGALDHEELDGVAEDDVDAGGYASFGLTTGAWWAWDSGFQLGGELGIEGFSGETEIRDETIELSGGGGFGAIGLGWRW